jgi:hypothetical protein
VKLGALDATPQAAGLLPQQHRGGGNTCDMKATANGMAITMMAPTGGFAGMMPNKGTAGTA